MSMTESDVDPRDPQWETFKLYQSWSVVVAREHFKRVTQKVLNDFYDRNIEAARAIFNERLVTLNNEVPS